ncbi:MAG: ATP-grasp domain-containing protein [Nitrospiraceae bacterium]|nr:ATP-grasp domain-containing protein [Nitrospiraceae bacterium]
MKIGLVYDLRKEYLEMGFSDEETAEFDSEETISALYQSIKDLGHEACRIGHIYELTRRLALGERWDLVFNVAEGLYGRSREAQVPALLEAFNIPYTLSDPLTLALALDKAMTKRIFRENGIPTPDFFVISSIEEAAKLQEGAKAPVPFPLFVKPVSEGTGKGITSSSIVHNLAELKNQARRLIAKYNQPVLAEAFLPGREFTVGVTGTGARARAAGVLEVKLLKGAEPGVYSYANKELCEERVKYTLIKNKKLAEEATELALKAYRSLECRDAGRVDIKAGEDGRFYVLEVNPLAGLHPTHSDLPILCQQAGMGYSELIRSILDSALERKKQTPVSGLLAPQERRPAWKAD